MSKLSIYENSWIDMVFEERNKEYGAYQLRQQSDRMTAMAFVCGLTFIGSILCGYFLSNLMNPAKVDVPEIFDQIIEVKNYTPPKPEQKQLPIPIAKKPDNPKPDEALVNPVITKPIDANQHIAQNKDLTNSTTTGTEGTTTTTNTTSSTSGTATTPNVTDVDDGVKIAATLDKSPEFPGGIEKFYNYVGKNFINPDTDEPKTLKVYVSFVIEKDGSMTDIQVKRDPGYGLAKEAIRVLKSLKTKWSPGILNGKPVRTAYNLPITVQIQ